MKIHDGYSGKMHMEFLEKCIKDFNSDKKILYC